MANYITPKNQEKKFTCPHCNTVSQMIYFSATWKQDKLLYDEAALIYNKSPRAACALLRLAVERLCNELGETGAIDKMIGSLVQKGLPTIVQKALDAVRVIGNKAVHPGQIAFDVDDRATAETLMKLLNIITERLITEPKEIDGIFDALPQSVKDSIEKRDKE